MDFYKLIKDPIFELPIKQSPDKYFDGFIEDLLNLFLEKVYEIDDGIIKTEKFEVTRDFIVMTQNTIVNGLINCIKEYLSGKPYKAYNILNSILQNEVKDLYRVIRRTTFNANNNFYRIRVKNEKENFAFSPIDLFHIPFSMRGMVTTQRYSIPGFPSLYLSKNLYVCWEELNRPEINKFQAIRLKNISSIRLLDLTSPDDNASNWEKYLYFMTWPLIACCSVKVKSYSDIFKPEYIGPQLLLQWVQSNDDLDGILYRSNHIDPSFFKQKGSFYNLVLPVKKTSYDGHCNKLKRMFETTQVLSWQLHEFALGGQVFVFNKDQSDKGKLQLELIKGRKYPYSYSTLGNLENYLDGMETFPIL